MLAIDLTSPDQTGELHMFLTNSIKYNASFFKKIKLNFLQLYVIPKNFSNSILTPHHWNIFTCIISHHNWSYGHDIDLIFITYFYFKGNYPSIPVSFTVKPYKILKLFKLSSPYMRDSQPPHKPTCSYVVENITLFSISLTWNANTVQYLPSRSQ